MFRLTEHADADRLVLTLEGRCSSEVVDELVIAQRCAQDLEVLTQGRR